MKKLSLLALVAEIALLSTACSSPVQQAPNKHAHYKPLSVDEHIAEATRHGDVADSQEAAAAASHERVATRCESEHPASSQTRIGTEPVRFAHPCFTSVTNPSVAHLAEARENRIEARRHRNAAAALVETEARECVGLDADSMIHSPFYHHEDIAEIRALEEGGTTTGVVVTFNSVRGLSREWLERALHCHQARAAALGYPSTYMTPHCLSSVKGAEIEVSQAAGRISVSVRGADGASAATILGRALGLTAAMATTRAREDTDTVEDPD